MTTVIFTVTKCKERDDGWHHPRHGFFISGDMTSDVFLLEAVDNELDKTLASYAMPRTCLEQVQSNCEKALGLPPLKIRRCP